MKSRKHKGITHINNSLAGRLEQGALPVQCLTAGAATLPSIHNAFSQTLRNHFAHFLNYDAKNVVQSLRRHYANIITQDTGFYADITQYIYAKITQKLRINYANSLRKMRRYYANTFTQ